MKKIIWTKEKIKSFRPVTSATEKEMVDIGRGMERGFTEDYACWTPNELDISFIKPQIRRALEYVYNWFPKGEVSAKVPGIICYQTGKIFQELWLNDLTYLTCYQSPPANIIIGTAKGQEYRLLPEELEFLVEGQPSFKNKGN